MKIKELKTFDEPFKHRFLQFCRDSKPYDFCSIRSPWFRDQKILEYFDQMARRCLCLAAEEDGKEVAVLFFLSDERVSIEFAIGNSKAFPASKVGRAAEEIIKEAQKRFDKTHIFSIIQRKHKKDKYVRWLKRYCKNCKMAKDGDSIQLFWDNDWSN